MSRVPDKTWTKKDFKIDWFSGTGAGGQHRNKHQNCVRITHIESGITTTGQGFRERSRNFNDAFQRLAKLIVDDHYGTENKERIQTPTVVRTYNEATNLITDHQTGKKIAHKDFDVDNLQSLIEDAVSLGKQEDLDGL